MKKAINIDLPKKHKVQLKDAALFSGISEEIIKKACSDGSLKHFEIVGILSFDVDELMIWVKMFHVEHSGSK